MKIIVVLLLFICSLMLVDAQTVRVRNEYGDKFVYIDGNTLRSIDKYGDKVFYFEGISEKWVIVCLIR